MDRVLCYIVYYVTFVSRWSEWLRQHGWDGVRPLIGIAVINPFCWPVRASLRRWNGGNTGRLLPGCHGGYLSGRYGRKLTEGKAGKESETGGKKLTEEKAWKESEINDKNLTGEIAGKKIAKCIKACAGKDIV